MTIGGLGDWFKKRLDDAQGVYQQANFLDNGRTFSTNRRGAMPNNFQDKSIASQAGNLARNVFQVPTQGVNTIRPGAGLLYGAGKIGAASIFGSDNDYNRTVNDVISTADRDFKSPGLMGVGSAWSSFGDASNASFRDVAGKTINTGAQTGTLVAPVVPIKGLGVVGSRLVNNAGQGLVGSTTAQLVQNGRVDPRMLARDTAAAAALGEVLPAAKAVTGRGVKIVAPVGGSSKAAQQVNRQLPEGIRTDNQGNVRAGGKDLRVGEIQDLTQAPDLSAFERAHAGGNIAEMQKIAARHPGDNRFSMNIEQTADQMVHRKMVKDPATGQMKLVNVADEAPAVAPGVKVRSLPETIKNSPGTVKEFGDLIESMPYTVKPNKVTLTNAIRDINKNPDQIINEVMGMKLKGNAVSQKLGSALPDSDQVAKAMVTVDYLTRKGNFETAKAITENLSRQSTELGRAIQVLSVYNKTTPAGVLKWANDLAKESGVDLDTTKLDDFVGRAKEIENMADGYNKDFARATLMRDVADIKPSTVGDKLAMTTYLAQLLNPKTAIRNTVGNLFMNAAHNVSDTLAAPIDMARSAVTGNPRQIYAPNLLVQGKGLVEGFNQGRKEAWAGIDTSRNLEGKYGVRQGVFKSPVGRTLERTMGVELSAMDNAFRKASHDQMLHNLMKGAKVDTPTPDMKATADAFGRYMTYQDDTALSQIAVGLKRTLNVDKPFGAGSFTINYPKTPANLINRAIAFSPGGFAKTAMELYKLAANKPGASSLGVEQAFSRAAVGSAGYVGTGAVLHNVGILVADDNKNKKDLTSLDKATGGGRYKINTSALKRYVLSGFDANAAKKQEGDQLVSYDWAQPAAVSLTMGANLDQQNNSKGLSTKKLKADIGNLGAELASGVQTIADQPLLQGVSRAFGAQSPVQGAINTLQNVPTSFIPTLAKQTRQLTDNTTRNTYDPSILKETANLVRNALPGASRGLPAQINPATGQPNQVYPGGNTPFNVFLNPAFTSNHKTNPVTAELTRLYGVTGDRGIVPETVAKNYKINKQDQILSAQDYDNMQKFLGEKNARILDELVRSPQYQSADDTAKANAINSVLRGVQQAGKVQILGDRPEKLESGAASILAGNGVNVVSQYQNQIDVEKFKTSNEKVKVIGDTVWYKKKDGTPASMPKVQYDYNQADSKLTLEMDRAKGSNNVGAWMKAAESKYNAMAKVRESFDPTTEGDKIADITLKMENLMEQVEKYQDYGGFKKGGSGRGRNAGLPDINVGIPSDLAGPVITASSIKAPQFQLKNKGTPSVKVRKGGVKIKAPKKLK